MTAWQPDRPPSGPTALAERDIPDLNRLFSEAFTERYRRDGLAGVRVPPLNPTIWTYALRDAGAGAMAWRDDAGRLVAFNVAHRSGSEGWMGPLAVRPDRQGLGLGQVIVRAAIDALKQHEVSTIGLETMPRTVDNIGFYSRLGFLPGCLTVTLTGDVPGRTGRRAGLLLSALPESERADLVQRCAARLARSAPGYDFTPEHLLTLELELGDTVVVERGGAVQGFALWHSAPLAEARGGDELRILKLFAASPGVLLDVLRAVEACAARLRIDRVAVRCQTAFTHAYTVLVRRGYHVRWTDLRMTLTGYPEAAVPADEILFSNWEI
jgi:GNAT superfamily N-acetyltransferase